DRYEPRPHPPHLHKPRPNEPGPRGPDVEEHLLSIVASVTSQAPERVRADLLAVPMFVGSDLGPGAEVVDAALGGGLRAFIADVGFSGKAGETLAVPVDDRVAAKAVLLVGLGPSDEVTLTGLRR